MENYYSHIADVHWLCQHSMCKCSIQATKLHQNESYKNLFHFPHPQKYCGATSEIGKVVGVLRKVFQDAKNEAAEQLEIILGDNWSLKSTASEGYSTDNNDGEGIC